MTAGTDPLTVQLDELVSWILATVGLGVNDSYIAYRIISCYSGFRPGLEIWFETPWFLAWVEWCSGMAMTHGHGERP